MPKRLFLLCLMLGTALCLCSCAQTPPEATAPPPAQTAAPVSAAPLSYLYFCERSSYVKPVDGYEFRAEDGKNTAYFLLSYTEEPYTVPVEQPWVDTLNSFVAQYGILSWDGFSGSAPGLLDGTSFGFELTLMDGTSVQAGGYGDFPDNYGDASAAIENHFLQLLPQDMRDW